HQDRPLRRLRNPAPLRRSTLPLVQPRRPELLEPPPPRAQRVPRYPRDTPELPRRQPRPRPGVQDQQPLLAAQRHTLDLGLRSFLPPHRPALPSPCQERPLPLHHLRAPGPVFIVRRLDVRGPRLQLSLRDPRP